MNSPVSKRPPPAKSRRSWRYFFQFSLRTLLGLTTLSALACWWFLQPKLQEEELAGKYLTLRRQVRLLPLKDLPLGPLGKTNYAAVPISEGRWRLHDQRGDVLVAGNAQADKPHGDWTVYHANGRKAAEGLMIHGLRSGPWRAWNAAGQLESEVTYALIKQIVGPASPETIEQAGPLVKVVPREHVGMSKNYLPDDQIHLPNLSERHGPARLWHSTGNLKCEGAYQRDLREGQWTFYDEQGGLTERGEYRRGLRNGAWLIHDAASGESQTIEFIADLPRAEFDQLIAELKQEITSGDLDRQITAVHRLDELGFVAKPVLIELLDEPTDDVKLMALRRLKAVWDAATWTTEPPPQVSSEVPLARLEAFADSPDPRLAGFAAFWLYQISAAHRDSFYDRLIAAVRQSRDPVWQEEVLRTLWATDQTHRQTTFEAIAYAQHHAPAPGHSMMFVCGNGLSSQPQYPFLGLALRCDGVETLIKTAIKSPDAKVRRFAIMVIDMIVARTGSSEPPQILNDGSGRMQFRIPAEFEQTIEDAKNDPDPDVRREAEEAGKWHPPVVG